VSYREKRDAYRKLLEEERADNPPSAS
jgi:hypothetical protein